MTGKDASSTCPPPGARRLRRLSRCLLLVLPVTGLLAVPLRAADTNAFAVTGSAPNAKITALFRRTRGWIGGDAAYSVRLDDDKVLWTFGDSWIGKIQDGKRVDCSMVNNAAAIQSLSQKQPLKFYWGTNRQAKALWSPNARGTYYWPGDAAVVDKKLYVFLHVIKPNPAGPPPFQFQQVGDILMQVANPHAEPSRWRVKTASPAIAGSKINFGVASLADENHLYAFCSCPSAGKGVERHPTILARIARSKLARLDMTAWEYWCHSSRMGNGQWQKKLSEPIVLLPDGAPEMSVSKVRGIPGIVAVYMPPFSRQIFVRHALKPEGPWSKPVLAYSCPEREKGVLLYSAKGHPEQPGRQGELAVTYCRNSEDFAWHVNRPEIYFPQAVTIRLTVPARGSR